MTKKMLNQNAKYDQRFLDKVEPKFEFSNKPINRLKIVKENSIQNKACLLYTSPSPRDMRRSRMPSSA